MTADIRFVVDTAETYSDILTAESSRYASSDARFARARSSDEEEYGSRLLLFQIHNSDLLDDPVLDLAESVVVFIEDGSCVIKIDADHVLLLPRQARHEVEIVVQKA